MGLQTRRRRIVFRDREEGTRGDSWRNPKAKLFSKCPASCVRCPPAPGPYWTGTCADWPRPSPPIHRFLPPVLQKNCQLINLSFVFYSNEIRVIQRHRSKERATIN